MQHYTAPTPWKGRTDGTSTPFLRWQQVIQCIDLNTQPLPVLAAKQKGIALLGFASDEGVRRNKGRVGAAQGPQALRNACTNLPVHFSTTHCFIDAGDIVCEGNALEAAQAALSGVVVQLLQAGYQPILLGGGHEITYGHATGIYQFLQNKTLGLLNFDTHFDIREPDVAGASSGTGFWQLAQERSPFQYLALGIQPIGNTPALFQTAEKYGVQHVPAAAFHFNDHELTLSTIRKFIASVDHIYFTTCLDVFSAAHAPGVSATAYNGLLPTGLVLQCYQEILHSGKVISADIAELNPSLDIDQRTAKLAASLVFEMVTAFFK